LVVERLAEERFVVDRLAVDFFAVDFFAVDFFAMDRFVADLRADPPFLAAPRRGGGTFAPFSRASERPMAIACSRLRTVPPCPFLPRFSVPFLRRRIALSTLFPAAGPYFRPRDDLPLDFLAAMEPPRCDVATVTDAGRARKGDAGTRRKTGVHARHIAPVRLPR
jgi:hypothetical protein